MRTCGLPPLERYESCLIDISSVQMFVLIFLCSVICSGSHNHVRNMLSSLLNLSENVLKEKPFS